MIFEYFEQTGVTPLELNRCGRREFQTDFKSKHCHTKRTEALRVKFVNEKKDN